MPMYWHILTRVLSLLKSKLKNMPWDSRAFPNYEEINDINKGTQRLRVKVTIRNSKYESPEAKG